MPKFLTRVVLAASLIAVASPAALACAMKRMPQQTVALDELFEAIDGAKDAPVAPVPAATAPVVEAAPAAPAPAPAAQPTAAPTTGLIAEVAQAS